MKIYKKAVYLVAFIALAVIMASCNKNTLIDGIPDFKQENAIKINDDLSIISTLVDTFSEDYYQKDELLKMITEEASLFNDKNGAGSIVAEKVEAEDGLVNAVLKFSGREVYATYNNAVFFVGTVENALNNGLKLDKTLIDIDNSEKTIDKDSLSSMMDTYILITNEHSEKGPLTIETFGKILYVNKGIENWHGNNSVRVADLRDELVYILFK